MSTSFSPSIWNLSRISLPLMLVMLSNTIMLLVDRLILAHYSTEAMNAAAAATMSYSIFLMGGMAIASIAEVLVGQYNGAKMDKETPKPVWQMIWFSLSLIFVFLPIAFWGSSFCLPPLLQKEGNIFFFYITIFAPIPLINAALSAFFIGRGLVKLVTFNALACNVLNGVLNYLLVFGIKGFFTPMGIKGSAIASVISGIVQATILFSVFLNKYHRKTFETHNYHFNKKIIWQCLKIGTPSSISRMVTITAWAMLFQIVSKVNLNYVTILTIANSLFLFFSFTSEGLSKGVITIASNLLGAKKEKLLNKLLCSGFIVHGIFMIVFAIPLLLYPNFLVHEFLPTISNTQDPIFQQGVDVLKWLWLFCIFNGVVWIFGSILIARQDTRFIMVVNIVGAWLFAILPIYIATNYCSISPSNTWGICNIYAIVNLLALSIRYKFKQSNHSII